VVLLNTDTALVRYVKVVTGTRRELQELEDVTASTYDRDDTTMCPDGTLSQQWGALVLTLYETYDISGAALAFGLTSPHDTLVDDLDEALGASVFGFASTDQKFLTESLEEVLGYRVQTGVQFYNHTS
jgi:hypothetical protein